MFGYGPIPLWPLKPIHCCGVLRLASAPADQRKSNRARGQLPNRCRSALAEFARRKLPARRENRRAPRHWSIALQASIGQYSVECFANRRLLEIEAKQNLQFTAAANTLRFVRLSATSRECIRLSPRQSVPACAFASQTLQRTVAVPGRAK